MRTPAWLARAIKSLCIFAIVSGLYQIYLTYTQDYRSSASELSVHLIPEDEVAERVRMNRHFALSSEDATTADVGGKFVSRSEIEVIVENTEEIKVTSEIPNVLKYGWFHPSSRHSHAHWDENQDWTTLKRSPPRIVVSFTTTPNRIGYLHLVLEAIMKQDLQPDAIYINIPKFCRRTGMEYIVPDWITKYPNITVNTARMDYGPATKLLPTLEVETDPETIILVIDDDVQFPSTHFSRLVEWAVRLPDAAVGGNGLNVTCLIHEKKNHPEYAITRETCRYNQYSGFFTFIRTYNAWACTPGGQMIEEYGRIHCVAAVVDLPLAVDVLEANSGLAVRRGFFDDTIYDFTKFEDGSRLRDCFFRVDDIWWAQFFSRKSIPRFVVPDLSWEKLGMERVLKNRVKKPYADTSDWPTEELPNLEAVDSLHNNTRDTVTCNTLAILYINSTSGWGSYPRAEIYTEDTPQQYEEYQEKYLSDEEFKEWKIRMSMTEEDYKNRKL